MIDQKLGIITVHDVNPSHSEEILTVTEQLNKLNVKYSLSIVPYYNKKYKILIQNQKNKKNKKSKKD
jgi:hypothetical protein